VGTKVSARHGKAGEHVENDALGRNGGVIASNDDGNIFD
jgi:hypothetical protein